MNPKCFPQDITYLLLKSNKINKPKSYYVQMLKSIITERTQSFQTFQLLNKTNCRKGSYGCEEQLLISKILLENSRYNHGSLSASWIDNRKSFDSAPYSCILKGLQLYNVSRTNVIFLKISMKEWKTNINLNHT